MFRNVITRQAPRQARLFTTSIRYQKSAVEIGKDALKKVDRAVSDAAVKGIETGETVVEKTKETIGTDKGEVKGNAKEAAGEIKGEVKGKAHEVAGQAKGKAEEVKGKI